MNSTKTNISTRELKKLLSASPKGKNVQASTMLKVAELMGLANFDKKEDRKGAKGRSALIYNIDTVALEALKAKLQEPEPVAAVPAETENTETANASTENATEETSAETSSENTSENTSEE